MKSENNIKADALSEEELFMLMDDIKYEDLLGDLELGEPLENLDNKVVMDKTFNKLGLKNRKKVPGIKRWAAAAVLLLVILSMLSPRDVIAGIKRAFQYIPGLNIAMEKNEERYVLKDRVKFNKEGKSLEVISIVIENEKNAIWLSVEGDTEQYRDARVEFRDGRQYKLSSYSIAGGGSKWSGNYGYERKFEKNNPGDFVYKEGEQIKIILGKEGDVVIPVSLKRADTFESYEELGPTCERNGLSITAVPKLEEGKLRVNLLTPSPQKGKIEEYGLNPNYKDEEFKYKGILGEKIALRDSQNKIINASAPGSFSPPLDVFYFDLNALEKGQHRLVVPYVKMSYRVDKDIELEMPRVGEKIELDNYVVNLEGYKLKIESIERKREDEVVLKIDTGYDEAREESLYEIKLGVKIPFLGKPLYQSWGGSFVVGSEKVIGPMNEISVSLNKHNMKKLKLNIEDIVTVKRGPWEIDIE